MSERKPRTRGNGQGTAFKQGATWTAQVTVWVIGEDGNKKRKFRTKKGFKLKRDALAYLDELRNAPTVNSDITFNALYLLWSADHFPRISKSSEDGYKSAYAKCATLYPRRFAGLKTADLQKVVDEAKSAKGEDVGRRSKADIKSLFSNLYKYALQNDYCDKDYAQYVVLPKKEKSKKDAFTPAEMQKLWDDYNNGNEFTGYILIMIYTGMRYGEISKIVKSNIHLPERYMIGGIKTAAGIDREIPICDKIYPIVEKIYNETEHKLLTMHEKVFYNDFRRALDRAGVRPLSPHSCRHTFATLMAGAGTQPAIITATIGHEDYSTTMGYTHIRLEEKLKAVNQL